ncbi:MAG: AAA family ATPase [Pseudomonadota bacterium]
MSQPQPIPQGDFALAHQLFRARRKLDEVKPQPEDAPEQLLHKAQFGQNVAREVIGVAEDAIRVRSLMAQVATFWGPATPMGDTPRVRVDVGGRVFETALHASIPPHSLLVGQSVVLTGDGACLVAADPERPTGGEIVRVLKHFTERGVRWLQVEEQGEKRRVVRVSAFLEGQDLRPGMGVRVDGRFAYEIEPDYAKQQSFLDECQIKVWDPAHRVGFEDIVGQEEAVAELRALVDWFAEPEAFAGFGAFPLTSIKLLSGPPGMGKSYLLRALAWALHEALGDRFKAYYIPASAVKNMYVGNSEARTRELFTKPAEDYRLHGIITLLIFEEIESMAGDRGVSTDNTSVSQSVVTTLLAALDGVMPLEGVCVVACTNHAGMLDPALKRPGRFGGDAWIRMDRLSPEAMTTIIGRHLSRMRPIDLDGSPMEQFQAAAKAAVELCYGEAIIGKDTVRITGRHLVSGAAATAAVKAAIGRLRRHQHQVRRLGIASPFRAISPALLFHGMVQTLDGVISSQEDRRNLEQAREFFAGSLVHEAELRSLVEVVRRPQLRGVPEDWDLSPMEGLEQAQA